MAKGFDHDPHSQAGHACPKNFFRMVDYSELARVETAYVIQRTVELMTSKVSGIFDVEHLCKIHFLLFQDVFPWAGELRLVGLSKPGGAPFAAPHFIISA